MFLRDDVELIAEDIFRDLENLEYSYEEDDELLSLSDLNRFFPEVKKRSDRLDQKLSSITLAQEKLYA